MPLVLLAFWIGIYPKPLFTVLDAPVRQIVQQVNPGYYNGRGATLPTAARRRGNRHAASAAQVAAAATARTELAIRSKARDVAAAAIRAPGRLWRTTAIAATRANEAGKR